MDLFSRLYKYQSTDKRSQLENFCTEGFCDILNRMTKEQQHNFLIKMGVCADSDTKIKWQTQYTITDAEGKSRYPDLVGLVDNFVRYLIEVKINACFTQGVDINGNSLSQLQIYDRWLSAHSPDASAGTLILLTDKTMPEQSFKDISSSDFGIKNRKLWYWQSVFEQLTMVSDIPHVEDYKQFLSNQGLAMDLPTRQDFAVMELLYSGAGRRLDGLTKSVFDRIKQKYSAETLFNWGAEDKYRHGGSSANWQGAICWSWVMLRREPYHYFYWGIQFPEYNEWDNGECHSQSKKSTSPCMVFGYMAMNIEYCKRAIVQFSENFGSDYCPGKLPPNNNTEAIIFDQTLPLSHLLDNNYNLDMVVDWLCDRIDNTLNIIKKLK
ncbi:hypothetical protein [Morganella morganii]|uniref:hypothetical protein n=1 Tax=Morganella morganii TaxID=582 RepID=UPI0023677DBA|nr:hypothetical protein [Morganella morganii]